MSSGNSGATEAMNSGIEDCPRCGRSLWDRIRPGERLNHSDELAADLCPLEDEILKEEENSPPISFRKLPISVTSFRNPLAPYCEDESCRRRASQEVELEGLTSLLCGRDAFLLQEELRELPEEG